jgi:YidC/Oxa1 family membrane protein insertase
VSGHVTLPNRAGRAIVALLASLTLLALLTLAVPVAAESPSPSAGAAPATTAPASVAPTDAAGATPTPGASVAPVLSAPALEPAPSSTPAPPCPIPSPAPTPTPPPSGSAPTPTPAPTAHPNLCPAELKGDPISLLSWLFTPIFQALFLALAVSYKILGDIGLAIIVTTLIIRLLLIPVFRAQIVSQRRMQILQPELKSIQAKYKGNRAKISEEQLKLYKDRGVNPASGCLPGLLQLVLLIPMYQVFNSGLSAPDISSMLQLFGQPLVDVACQFPGNPLQPCINPTVHWLFGLQANVPQISFHIPGIGFGLSILAVVSALLQVIQTRMMATVNSSDPQARTQQRIFLVLPLFSILYGNILPAGLFIYWIVTTVFSIVQQYLIAGWGGLFPLFGWTPGFARDHTPRFPVSAAPLPPRVGQRVTESATPTRRSPTDRAAGTVRPNRERGRTSRRGRRR